MSFNVYSLDYARACREVERQINAVRDQTKHAIAFLEMDTALKRQRIEARLQEIEDDVSWRRAADSEVPFQ